MTCVTLVTWSQSMSCLGLGTSSRVVFHAFGTFNLTAHCQRGVLDDILRLGQVGVMTKRFQSMKAVPISEPVYLAMATPLIPKKEFHPPQESVAVLDPTVFNHPVRRDILQLCVVHYLDSLRQGTASTKTRGEVRGSGRKIRPQKGLGAARLGGRQSPMLRGGGVAFGPKPRDFSTKLPRKVIQMGMRVALSAKVKENKLGLVEKHDWPSGKTNSLAHRVDYLGWRKSLLVTGAEKFSVPLQRAGRNLAMVGMSTAAELTVYDIVKWPRLILDVAAVDYFERRLSRTTVVPQAQ